jgi:C_GCAxxG_C_C family probable redox protein
MEKNAERARALMSGGLGCAPSVVAAALEMRGEENPALVRAVAGLCGGMGAGLACGALTGAVCALSLFAGNKAEAKELAAEMAERFKAEIGSRRGDSVECSVITGGDRDFKRARCPGLTEEAYAIALDILEERGKI